MCGYIVLIGVVSSFLQFRFVFRFVIVSSKNNAKKKEKTQRLEEKEKGKRRMQQTTHSKKNWKYVQKIQTEKTEDDTRRSQVSSK